jgi:transcriptional regulator with XRE-family HTH domain
MERLKDIPVLADRLIYVRKVKGLTQADLAQLAGTSQQAIQQAESGKALSPRYLPRLARALTIPVEWLTLNEMPADHPARGMSEKDDEVLSAFKSMPAGDQKLLLDLMKSRAKSRP